MEIKELATQMQSAWSELKGAMALADAEAKKHGTTLGDTSAKVAAIESKLADLNQLEQRLNARLDAIEVRGKRPAAGGNPTTPEAKEAFLKFARKGAEMLSAEERKFMSVSDDTAGGYLADPEMVAEIIKDIVEISPLRSICRVRTTSQRSVKVRARTGVPSAVWTGAERVTKTATTQLKYGLVEIPNHEIYALCDVSNQDLEDSAFDLEGEIRTDTAEQFAVAEGVAFLNGSGVGEPSGIMTDSRILIDKSGDASLLTYDGMVDVSHNIKAGYAAAGRFLFNRKTLGVLRKLKNATTGDPLWTPMTADAPSMILGSPYSIVQEMDDVASNKYPVAFGDFRRGYIIVDRLALSVLRDPVTQATEGAVRFILRKRLGGQVVQPEAIRKLKIST